MFFFDVETTGFLTPMFITPEVGTNYAENVLFGSDRNFLLVMRDIVPFQEVFTDPDVTPLADKQFYQDTDTNRLYFLNTFNGETVYILFEA